MIKLLHTHVKVIISLRRYNQIVVVTKMDRNKKRASDLAYYHRHSAVLAVKNHAWYLNKKEEMKRELSKVFGSTCKFCPETGRLEMHEIHFEPHTRSGNISQAKYYIEHQEDFIRVCSRCHKMIHILGKLSREKVLELLSYVECNRLATLTA